VKRGLLRRERNVSRGDAKIAEKKISKKALPCGLPLAFFAPSRETGFELGEKTVSRQDTRIAEKKISKKALPCDLHLAFFAPWRETPSLISFVR
jgi:hypothetical protein